MFPAGSAVQTTLGLAGVVLLALDDAGDDYLLLVRSSFARYLADWLLDAATEYSTDPGQEEPDAQPPHVWSSSEPASSAPTSPTS